MRTDMAFMVFSSIVISVTLNECWFLDCPERCINDFIVCLGYKGYMIKEYFANYFLHNSDVTIDAARNEVTYHHTKAEPWRITLPMAICTTLLVYFVFDQLLTIPWPQTYLGDWFPALKGVIPSV